MTENKWFKKRRTEDTIRKIVPFEKEFLSKNYLYEFQKDVLKNSSKNFMYRTDTGTGKTLIAIYHFLNYTNNNKKLLVVCPKAKLNELGWHNEIRNIELYYNISIDFEVVTYGKLRKMVIDYEELANTFIIYDECHNVKNPQSQQGKGATKINKYAYGFILLSATPTPQGYSDMLNYFLMFDKIKNWYEFREKYCGYQIMRINGRQQRIYNNVYTPKAQEMMKEMIGSFSSKALKKEDCLDLPSQVFVTPKFSSSKGYDILNRIAKEVIFLTNLLNDGSGNKKEMVDVSDIHDAKRKSFYIKAYDKQMYFLLDEETNVQEILTEYGLPLDYKLDSVAKLQYCLRLTSGIVDKIEWIDEFISSTDNNIILFYNFISEYTKLKEMLAKHDKIKELSIYESKNIPSMEYVEKDKNQKVVLVQIAQGGAGLNLQYCTEVVYLTPDWNFGNYEQSLGRAYRNGQTNKVTVYNLVAEDTIDERIYERLYYKKEVNDEIERYRKDKFITPHDFLFLNGDDDNGTRKNRN